MKTPFAPARERVKRAEKHLRELTDMAESFNDLYGGIASKLAELEFGSAEIADLLESGSAAFTDVEKAEPVLSLLIGEVAYNLRAALDYLVFTLAELDSGHQQDGTQFPIESTPKGFAKKRKTYLRSLNDRHVAEIEFVQPYTGCVWTKQLRSLSNPDKHRHLTRLQSQERIISGPDDTIPQDIIAEIAFRDGTPVIGTLEKLHSEIGLLIDAFEQDWIRTHFPTSTSPVSNAPPPD